MGMKILNSMLCMLFLITGCSILGSDNEHNGRNEITVTGTESILIGLKLKDEMLKLGYILREQSVNSIVFDKSSTASSYMPFLP